MTQRYQLLGSMGLLLLVDSCDTTQRPPADYEYRVHVDSVEAPTSVSLGDTVVIRFYGVVSPDDCGSFLRIEDTPHGQEIDFSVWAIRRQQVVCSSVMVYLQGEEYRFVATKGGTTTITIYQPNGLTLQHLIEVQVPSTIAQTDKLAYSVIDEFEATVSLVNILDRPIIVHLSGCGFPSFLLEGKVNDSWEPRAGPGCPDIDLGYIVLSPGHKLVGPLKTWTPPSLSGTFRLRFSFSEADSFLAPAGGLADEYQHSNEFSIN